jgi:hypothetical protein
MTRWRKYQAAVDLVGLRFVDLHLRDMGAAKNATTRLGELDGEKLQLLPWTPSKRRWVAKAMRAALPVAVVFHAAWQRNQFCEPISVGIADQIAYGELDSTTKNNAEVVGAVVTCQADINRLVSVGTVLSRLLLFNAFNL